MIKSFISFINIINHYADLLKLIYSWYCFYVNDGLTLLIANSKSSFLTGLIFYADIATIAFLSSLNGYIQASLTTALISLAE